MRALDRLADSPHELQTAWHGAFVLLYAGALLFHLASAYRHLQDWRDAA
jgi:hypothetical protein